MPPGCQIHNIYFRFPGVQGNFRRVAHLLGEDHLEAALKRLGRADAVVAQLRFCQGCPEII